MSPSRIAIVASLAVAASFAPVVGSVACSATTANAVIQDITPAGACIANALLSGGVDDPLQIVAQCAGITIDDVIQVVEQLLAAQPDAGVADGGASPLATRLAAIHVRAQGLKAAPKAGGK